MTPAEQYILDQRTSADAHVDKLNSELAKLQEKLSRAQDEARRYAIKSRLPAIEQARGLCVPYVGIQIPGHVESYAHGCFVHVGAGPVPNIRLTGPPDALRKLCTWLCDVGCKYTSAAGSVEIIAPKDFMVWTHVCLYAWL